MTTNDRHDNSNNLFNDDYNISHTELSNNNSAGNECIWQSVLYNKDVRGKLKEWNIKVFSYKDFSIISVLFGYKDGKMTESVQKIETGKNIGRKNETSHSEQAILEAKSKWNKKKDSGYTNTSKTVNEQQPEGEKIKSVVENKILFPMLANEFGKHKNKIVFPCYMQPKLDGYRCLYNTKTKYCNSRAGKEFDILRKTNLYKELVKIQLESEIIFDGELYIHNGIFEHLGMLRKKKLSNDDLEKLNKIEYHIYDIVDTDKPCKERFAFLSEFFSKHKFIHIKFVETKIANSQNDIIDIHRTFIKDNYEGSMIRNMSGKYRCKARSSDLLKYKDFKDSEFKIVDFTFEKDNDNKDLIVWICETKDSRFHIRPKGTKEERKMLYHKGSDFIGQLLHVKFFELTEAGIPRFPTTKSDSYTTYIRNVIE